MVYQLRFGGGLAGGDIWMFSWWATSGQSIDTVHAAATAWAGAFWTGGYDAVVTPDVTLTTLSTLLINDADGKQQQRRDNSFVLSGNNVSGNLPADVAIVTSLRTDLANRRGRGRFYLPQPAINQLDGSNGRMTAACQTAVLNALETAWGGFVATGVPVVYSRASRNTNPVVRFDVGDLFDTQRGRENAMLEARVSRDMP